MLILTRKRNESIKIGKDIVIKVVQTKPGLVKLGIEAPTDVRVLRAELAEFVSSPNDQMSHSTESNHELEHSVATSSADSFIDFNTEYAIEIEEQMLCVATD